MKKVSIFLILLTSFIVGCNALKVKTVSSADPSIESRTGLAYSLQFTQYNIKITRGLSNCESLLPGGDEKNPQDYYNNVKPYVKAEITPTLVDDANHVYVIDSESLNGLTKVSDLEVNWTNGKLTSINAASDDKAGDIVVAAVSGIAKIAIATAAGGAPIPVAGSIQTTVACTEEASSALKNVLRLENEIKGHSAEIEDLALAISEFEADLEKSGKKPTIQCGLKKNKDEIQCKLEASLSSLKSEKKLLDAATENLKVSKDKVSYEQTFTWPNESTERESSVNNIADQKYNKWIADKLQSKLYPDGAEVPDIQKTHNQLKSAFNTFFVINKIGSYGVSTPKNSVDTAKSEAGIRYRVPAQGYVAVCKEMSNKGDCNLNNKSNVIASYSGPIMQYGHIFYVPFTSKVFSGAKFSLSFDEMGRLKVASVSQTKAPGEGMAKAFDTIAKGYSDVKAARSAEEEKNKPKTELELIQEKVALTKAKKELVDSEGKLTVTPLEELQQKIALAEAEKKYLEAQKALNPVVEEVPTASEQELSIIQSNTTILQARVANLNAQIAIKKAEEVLAEK